MIGTLINVAAVFAGGGIGLLVGNRLSERLRETIMAGMGLFLLAYAITNFIKSQQMLIPLAALTLGAVLGEWWKIEDGLARLGTFFKEKFSKITEGDQNIRFVDGFVATSLIICVGPLAILGSIQDGLQGDFQLLAIKSILDFFICIAFASTLGVGVLFSGIILFAYQGTITLLAQYLEKIMSEPMILEMTATGGLLLMSIAVSSLLGIKKIRTGNFLPALVIAPLLVWLLSLIGIQI